MDLSYSYRPKNSVKFSQAQPTTSKARRRRANGLDDIEFTNSRQRSAGILKKTKKKKIELKKIASADPKNFSVKQKIFWVFVGLTVLRLFFMDRGIWDFYKQKQEINDINIEISRLDKENMELISEIKKIKYDPIYQKKMARQHLGVIARDEYLILFAEEKAETSI